MKYMVTPSFEYFESRHEAIGEATILEREFPKLRVKVVVLDGPGMEAMDRVKDTLDEVAGWENI